LNLSLVAISDALSTAKGVFFLNCVAKVNCFV